MYKVDLYAKVRRAVMVDGHSERSTAKRFGISRKSVSKMLRHSVPPGYQRKEAPVSPKLGPFVGIINQILLDDRAVLKKQRHTATRIFERLRDEHGYQGGYTVVREFIAKERLRQQEVFVPLAHPPARPARPPGLKAEKCAPGFCNPADSASCPPPQHPPA